jgi:hypothetical protein
MADFFCESEHVARKKHLCDFCSTAINIGERYTKATGVFEGDFFVLKEHLDCHAASIKSMQLSGDYSFMPLWDMDDEDRVWIKQDYPTIFERMADHD